MNQKGGDHRENQRQGNSHPAVFNLFNEEDMG